MKKIASFLALITVAPAMNAGAVTLIHDTFDSIDPAWVTDRYEPDDFDTVVFDGDSRLLLSISVDDSAENRPPAYSGMFYNTQGRKQSSVWDGEWTMEAMFYISDDWIDGISLRRTDLWARTGNVGIEIDATYPIIGFVQNNEAAPLDPTAPLTPRYRVWDPEAEPTDGWVELPNTPVPGWNTVAISGSADGVRYYLNGDFVHYDNTGIPMPTSLTDTFIQAYNFGNGNYSSHWDNVVVSGLVVPEPSVSLLAGMSALGLLARRKRTV